MLQRCKWICPGGGAGAQGQVLSVEGAGRLRRDLSCLKSYHSVNSVVSDSLQPHGLQHTRLSLSFTDSRSLLKVVSIESVVPSNHLILCRPLLPPSIFPSIKVFSSESALLIRWPRYWRFSLNISPSNEYSGLISFRMDWFDLLAVQRTLKSPPTPQFKSVSSSVLGLYCPTQIRT